MNRPDSNSFSRLVTSFMGGNLPEPARLAGMSALIDHYGLDMPLPFRLSAIGQKHKIVRQDDWLLLTPRHAPDDSLEGHLIYTLKHEGVDLLFFQKLFSQLGPAPIEDIVKNTPTGSYSRRLWFLYEWLMDTRLDLPDVSSGRYINALDPKLQYCGKGQNSSRHRVVDNLPGTPAFCPHVYRTDKLDNWQHEALSDQARDALANLPKDIVTRTAAFLLLKDSKSSYAIEGETAPQDRLQRWGRAIGEAGQTSLDKDELLRLQQLVIGDDRFVQLGLRATGGFIGEHDRLTRQPLPAHISAKHQDLPSLMDGLLGFDKKGGLDPVILAACMAFGFVYIHPFEDGNGRLHRYIIHHILSEYGFNPPGVIFPVSAVILDRIDDYKQLLESISSKILPFIKWRPTADFNVDVLNETADLYRFFDATAHAQFLYDCVARTIREDLPEEARFLQWHDSFCTRINSMIDMPPRLVELLFSFLHQNDGTLSRRALTKEFEALTQQEVEMVEHCYATSKELYDN